MNMQPIIEVKDVGVVYGDNTILEKITFDVYPGEILVIVGGSGSGKSVLLRQITGLEKPTTGTVIVQGQDLTSANNDEKRKIQKKFGILFQSSGLFASMTIAENISLLLESFTDLSEDEISDIIDIKLRAVGLDGFRNYLPSEISGGMKKRAALARALALDPDILFFDEPSSGLDPVTAASLDNLIKSLNESLGATMVVVSHDLASIGNIAHRVILLDKETKGIIAQGNAIEMKNNIENEKVYKFFNRIAY
ncbi:MAG: polyamine ABC transporter ATP-binding protein [Ignavibacteria bacterium GWB2_35_12]|nr:MAG: polyamine ABC transporter ATP-binding protein [Ignavibacteria bacterium GWB2_35_12]OGU91434.1 MAG: polyamine ABC transporter ATP-binding protein [Ignavibacteria bacterium RIFOXYA2_FULL_35_10]OGV22220.1 MAG: polyamine ABC transporter ATP-binding protein [Ignavibacteria bacterium RIFOXYC2_FULL_35_21]